MSPAPLRLVAIALAALLALPALAETPKRAVVVLAERVRIAADVVDTPALRERGLSGRAGLAEREGMLFLFPAPAIQTFWMKGMNFPIDIVWIQSGRIVGVSPDVPPPPRMLMQLPRYASPVPCDHVLELRAGASKRLGLSVGDAVRIEH
jgi:hypothetical protein